MRFLKGILDFFWPASPARKILGFLAKKITLFVNIRREAPKKIGFLGSQNAIFKGVFDFFWPAKPARKF